MKKKSILHSRDIAILYLTEAALPATIPWNNLNAHWRRNIVVSISECSLQPAVCEILPQAPALPKIALKFRAAQFPGTTALMVDSV